MFAALLDENNALRATKTAAAILAHGVRGALVGGLAIAAQLRVHGRPVERQELNDIDLVVEGFGAVPESMAASFLPHHVHPDADEGKILLQLIDETTAVRVDLFRTFGNTLTRASALDEQTGVLSVLSVEDLVARTTALVCGSLKRGATIDPKHATAFIRLLGLGRQEQLAAAWNDHRQTGPGTLEDAARETIGLLDSPGTACLRAPFGSRHTVRTVPRTGSVPAGSARQDRPYTRLLVVAKWPERRYPGFNRVRATLTAILPVV